MTQHHEMDEEYLNDYMVLGGPSEGNRLSLVAMTVFAVTLTLASVFASNAENSQILQSNEPVIQHYPFALTLD